MNVQSYYIIFNNQVTRELLMILVTGGAGFIGSNFVIDWMSKSDEEISIIDCLTYAGNIDNLSSIINDKRINFIRGSINDELLLEKIFSELKPRAVIHFAAESHVDRSISSPWPFIETNIIGTFRLLEVSKRYWSKLESSNKSKFRYIHVSTDEVFGTLSENETPFTEENPYKPNSPYAASKAASDHLVRAYGNTYGLPTLITNCSNNYGPYQFPEKLIPVCITRALRGESIPIYGDGKQIRDWLYVTDHCSAIRIVLEKGLPGNTYNIGGENEVKNINLVLLICNLLDTLSPRLDKISYKDQIKYVDDREGHDRRYAINNTKIKDELSWSPVETFESGIRKTVTWYLNHLDWVQSIYHRSSRV